LWQVGGSKKCRWKSFNQLSDIEKFSPSGMKLSSYFHLWKNAVVDLGRKNKNWGSHKHHGKRKCESICRHPWASPYN
jgi:hypothetical protein